MRNLNTFCFCLCLLGFTELHSQNTSTIYFDNDSYQLNNEQILVLDSILQGNDIKRDTITIKGYANAYGTMRYNQILSQKRALSVAQYVESEGFVIENAQGYGETLDYDYSSRKVLVTITKGNKEHKTDTSLIKNIKASSLDTLEVGEKIIFKNLNFVGGTDEPLFKSQAYLIELFEYLRDNPKIKLKFIGHICCHGNMNPKTDGINTRTNKRSLSLDRAKSVYDYMVNSGIEDTRLSYEGRAYTEPLGKKPEEDRRVEIELIANE